MATVNRHGARHRGLGRRGRQTLLRNSAFSQATQTATACTTREPLAGLSYRGFQGLLEKTTPENTQGRWRGTG